MGFNARPNDYDPLQKALEAGRNAVEADPQIPAGHTALSNVHFYLGDIELALVEIDKALALNPNDTAVLAPAGFWYGSAGRYERGVALATKAIALNPNAIWWTYVPILHKLYLEGNYQGFLDVARKADWPELF